VAGDTVSIGPFIGGLNTQSDEGAVNDDELVICQNFEVELDGSLRSRAPLVTRNVALPSASGWRMLGYFTNSSGVTFPVGAIANGGTYYLSGTSWLLITGSLTASAVAQFNGKLYLLSNYSASGGTWDGTSYVADSAMPKGTSIVAYKGRLWVSDTTQVRYSSVIVDSNFWTLGGTYGGSFKVAGGDGQSNVKLVLAYGNLLIFRTTSIWSFSYSTDPAYGQQSQLIAGVGLDSPDALESFEGIIYFMYNGAAYTLNGANTSQINPQVPFKSSSRISNYAPFSVSVVNRKIIFSYYDVMYVWNLRSRTWTTWTTPAYAGVGKFLIYQGALTGDNTTYITHSSYSSRGTQTLFFTDVYTSEAESDSYTSIARTKTFDYATPDHFKRIFWWGVDMLSRVSVTGQLLPVVARSTVTWGQVRQLTWGQLRQRTWGSPAAPSIDTSITAPALSGSSRAFYRFPRAMRFRRMRYQVSLTSNGSMSQAPNKLFGMETVVSVKQLVPRQVS
jgi:hypothetical protein